jgi:hypothetical protein
VPLWSFSGQDVRALIEYARRKFADERYPLDPALEPIRQVLDKLDRKAAPEPKPAEPKRRR